MPDEVRAIYSGWSRAGAGAQMARAPQRSVGQGTSQMRQPISAPTCAQLDEAAPGAGNEMRPARTGPGLGRLPSPSTRGRQEQQQQQHHRVQRGGRDELRVAMALANCSARVQW